MSSNALIAIHSFSNPVIRMSFAKFPHVISTVHFFVLLQSFSSQFSHIQGFSTSIFPSRSHLHSPPVTNLIKRHNVILHAESSDDPGLSLSSDTANEILSSAFSSLKEEDKYDTVLTGICAKILNEEDSDEDVENEDMLSGPLSLLGEMNTRRVKASPRSLSALIDVRDCNEGSFSKFLFQISCVLTYCSLMLT